MPRNTRCGFWPQPRKAVSNPLLCRTIPSLPSSTTQLRKHVACRRLVCPWHTPSRPGESHPEPLTDPCLTVSRHTARAIRQGCRLHRTGGLLLFPVGPLWPGLDGLPPSLRGRYSVSSLLRGSPSLGAAFVRSPSWLIPLAASPFASAPKVPMFRTTASSRLSPPVCRMPLRP